MKRETLLNRHSEQGSSLPRLRIELPAEQALRDEALVERAIDQVWDEPGLVILEVRVVTGLAAGQSARGSLPARG